jgi:hypothetical protein
MASTFFVEQLDEHMGMATLDLAVRQNQGEQQQGAEGCLLVVVQIHKNWVHPNPNLLPFFVRLVRIRFESKFQKKKKDLRFDAQRFLIKIWYFTK